MRVIRTLLVAAASAALASSAQAALLYQNNFDGNLALDAGVTGGLTGVTSTTTATTGAWNADGWVGNVLRNDSAGNPASFTTLSLGNLATHTSVSMTFLLGFLDSWDSSDGSCCSPDHLEVWIDGVQVADLTSNNALGSVEDYDGGTELYDGSQIDNASFSFSDTLVDMGTASFLTFAHSAPTLTVAFRASGTGWQGGADESFGLDNIVLSYDGVRDPGPGGVPEPGTWALMIAGFGFAGSALRRRRTLVV